MGQMIPLHLLHLETGEMEEWGFSRRLDGSLWELPPSIYHGSYGAH